MSDRFATVNVATLWMNDIVDDDSALMAAIATEVGL